MYEIANQLVKTITNLQMIKYLIVLLHVDKLNLP